MVVEMGGIPGVEKFPRFNQAILEGDAGRPGREISDGRREPESVIAGSMPAGSVSMIRVEGVMEMGLQAGVVPALEGGIISEAPDFPTGSSKGEIDSRLGHPLCYRPAARHFPVFVRKRMIEGGVALDTPLWGCYHATQGRQRPGCNGEGDQDPGKGRHQSARGSAEDSIADFLSCSCFPFPKVPCHPRGAGGTLAPHGKS